MHRRTTTLLLLFIAVLFSFCCKAMKKDGNSEIKTWPLEPAPVAPVYSDAAPDLDPEVAYPGCPGNYDVVVDFEEYAPKTEINYQYEPLGVTFFSRANPNLVRSRQGREGNYLFVWGAGGVGLGFRNPVGNLCFEAVGVDSAVGAFAVARFTFADGSSEDIELRATPNQAYQDRYNPSNNPLFLDLSQFSEIVSLELIGTDSQSGVGWDNFSFSFSTPY